MGLSEEADRDVAAPAHRAPVKGGWDFHRCTRTGYGMQGREPA